MFQMSTCNYWGEPKRTSKLFWPIHVGETRNQISLTFKCWPIHVGSPRNYLIPLWFQNNLLIFFWAHICCNKESQHHLTHQHLRSLLSEAIFGIPNQKPIWALLMWVLITVVVIIILSRYWSKSIPHISCTFSTTSKIFGMLF